MADRTMELYNLTPKETWRDVLINPELSDEQKKTLWNPVEYGDIFSDVPTTTHLMEHKIDLTSNEPIRSKPYKIPVHLNEAVEKEINDLLEHGWIEKSNAA
jgi:hypothetical protein